MWWGADVLCWTSNGTNARGVERILFVHGIGPFGEGDLVRELSKSPMARREAVQGVIYCSITQASERLSKAHAVFHPTL